MKSKLLSQVSRERLELHMAIPLATPFVIYIEPSGYCNLKCVFCPVGIDGDGLTKDLMPVELFEKLMLDLTAFEGRVKLFRFCGNGEPLVNKDIVEILRIASASGLVDRIEMLTNGVLLNDRLIKDLTQYLNRIIISIEGLSSEDYRNYCDTSIEFDDLLSNLDKLYATRGDCTVHVKIHQEAVQQAEKKELFYNLFKSRCDEIFIENLVPMWPQLDSNYFSKDFRWEKGEVTSRKVCAQIFKGMQVQANGEVVPCCVDWKRVNVLGNINDSALSDIWQGDKLKDLQVRHLSGKKDDTEPCKACTMNDYCEYDNLDLHAEEGLQRLSAKL